MPTSTIPVQPGPVYTCFTCGGPARLDRAFSQMNRQYGGSGYGLLELDEWGDYIWYLRKPCRCRPERVVRLGDCLAPLYPRDADYGLSPADIPRVRQALAAIAAAVPPGGRSCDPAAAVVYRLLAGWLSPDGAIAEIRALSAAR